MGAGASYNSIPTIKGDENRSSLVDYIYETLLSFTHSNGVFNNFEESNESKELFEFARNEGLYTATQFREYGTPDTYARSLYLKGVQHTKDYDNIRVTLSLFFVLWKFEKQNLFTRIGDFISLPDTRPLNYHFEGNDSRYTSFFASILNPGKGVPSFPDNLKILTWNYDSEIEDVLLKYFLRRSPNLQMLNTVFNLSNFHENENLINKNIIKLNGNYYDVNEPIDNSFSSIIDSENDELIINMNQSLHRFNTLLLKRKYRPTIQFSWDNLNYEFSNLPNDEKITINFKSLENILHEAERLIIIGYSFPIFNREMDSFMIRSFLGSKPDMKAIHIQNTENSMDGIKQRIRALSGYYGKLNFQEHLGLDEFYIPFEFN